MDPKTYSEQALRTEHTPDFVRLVDKAGNPRDPDHNKMVARILHALLGMISETGEIADAVKRHIIYGAEWDRINMVEESGDRSWYENLFLAAVQSSWEESWAKNIAKLKARFGDKFTADAALNRDLDAERAALTAPGAHDLRERVTQLEAEYDELFKALVVEWGNPPGFDTGTHAGRVVYAKAVCRVAAAALHPAARRVDRNAGARFTNRGIVMWHLSGVSGADGWYCTRCQRRAAPGAGCFHCYPEDFT